MGNSQNSVNPSPSQEQAVKINHEKFANRQILKNSPEETLILIKLALPHQKEYNTWVQQLAKTDSHESLLLPKSHQFKREGFCGLSGIVEIIFQNYPFLLSDEINNRYCMGTKYFEQSQLWYLVLTLLSAAETFHSKNKKVGDIRPENVFISEDGSVKVACLVSWPMERSNYEKSFQKQTTYIAPEQTDDLRFGKLDPSSNFKLAETFSIGLTLLDAATLSDSKDVYKSQSSIDYDTLQLRLKELQQNEDYSSLLRSVIQNMCEVKPENRTSCQQLFQFISPFEEQINNFQQFEPTELPQKIKARILSESQIQKPQPPISNSQYNPTYVSNTYVQPYQTTKNFSFTQPPSTLQPQILQTFHQPSPHIVASNYLPAYEFASAPVRKTYQLPHNNGIQTSMGSNYSESVHVGLSGKFSLQKIDQQLQQSRKMFPS